MDLSLGVGLGANYGSSRYDSMMLWVCIPLDVDLGDGVSVVFDGHGSVKM